MKSLKLNVLSKEDASRIDDTCLGILEKTGILVDHEPTRGFLAKQGCTVDGKIVKFPRELVREAMSKAPHSFTFHSRDGDHDVKMVSDGSRTNFMNLGMGTRICHYRGKNTFETLDSTIPDIENIAKLEDGLENFDLMTLPVSALDLMTKNVARSLYEVRAIITNTSKPHLTDPVPEYVDDYFKIMKAIYSGDEEEARKKPFMMGGSCSSSPLQLDSKFCLLSEKLGSYGMPFMTMAMAMSGSTAPVDLAGTIVVHNCEALAGITLTQLFNPGAPSFYGSCTTNFDFMTNTAPFGSPENALISSASAQMSQFYGIPSVTSGAISDAKRPGFQSAQEATMNAMVPALVGTSNVFGGGLIELGMSYSMEQAALVDDMIPLIRKVIEGIDVCDDRISLEDITEVGPGGNFIPLPKTMNGMFGLSHPSLFDRNMYDEWAGQGMKDSLELAHEKVNDILTNHVPAAIEKDAMAEVDKIIKEADRRLA